MCDNNEAIGLIGVLISLSDPISRSSDFAMRMLPFSLLSFFVLMWIPLYYVRRLEAKKEKAYEQAAAAIKAKSEFLSNMSHEIRTPINAITGMASIGKSSEDIKQMAYCFERVEDASGLLLGTINNILDMSKIDSGKFDLSASEFSFEKMLHSVINTVNQQIHEKRLKLKVSIDRTIPEIVIGDEQRLAHIVFNLMSNAIKFSPEEGSIHIGTYFLGEKDGICTIKATVTDSGIGISPEQQPNLFSPFWQLESSMSRQFDGSGLGLTISKNIVEMMGGKIWVESEFEKGATFAFTIKVKKGVAKKRNFLERGITWSNVRVLVVDDDPDTRDFFMKITGTLGVKCDTASSGEEALGLVEQGKAYDICFVDWLLPEIDGFELARILKTKAENPENIAVIVFSAAALDTANDNDKGAYIDKYLSKPLFPFTIIDTINDCLGMADDGHIRKMKHETLPQFAGRRILLVEDVEINREIVLTLLKPTLIEIICVDNGKDAVSTFSEAPEKYDLILMDLQMPQMDGYEATRNIRALDFPKAKAIPILAMTAHSFDEDVVKCLNVGMNGHIGKPLDYDELLEQLFIYLSDM
jgi:signal transduction histidine kinase/DNA-binding response OmpR family regulator